MSWPGFLPGVLIALGAALAILAFLRAFTIYGEVSAAVGVVLVLIGSVLTGRRPHQKAAAQPGQR
jgi:hypothetical protein